MVIKENNKPTRLIGYPESSFSLLIVDMFYPEDKSIELITPAEFDAIEDKNEFNYGLVFSLDMNERQEYIKKLEPYDVVSCIDNSSYISSKAKLGRGLIVGHFSAIYFDACIGDFSIIETHCLIAHHVTLGKNTICAPGTSIAGRTTIGENTVIGFGSNVLNKLTVAPNTVIGAYTNVSKNIEVPGFYVGSPARRLKTFE